MRRLLIVLSVLLLLPLSASAWMSPIVCSGGGQSAPACADSSCTGFLVCQNFEGTGYDNSESWSETGTVDEDYTSIILRGSQSLCVAASSTAVISYGATNEVYGHILFRIENIVNATCFQLLDASSNVLMNVDIASSYFRQQSPWYGNLAEAAADTNYRLWFHYRCKIDSTNGIAECGVTAASTRKVPVYTSSVAVTSTTQSAKLLLAGSTNNNYHDQILVDEANIATVCE